LDQVLAGVPRWADENVLIGFDTADDAGVYKLSAELALVQTVDFFTPIVDDPYTYGAIAAANSLSDVYAMGGRPISALSIVAFPARGEPSELQQILKGGAEKMHEAGCSILGGHSIVDDEIKFGYAVTGTIHPARVKANAGARPGDALVFTKRLGTGVIATALKRGIATPQDVEASIQSMLTLNRDACEAMLQYDVHGCTDVTGFGLIGHAREMALASNVTLEIRADRVRFLLNASGWRHAELTRHDVPLCLAAGNDIAAAAEAATWMGPLARRLAAQGHAPELDAAVRRAVAEALRPYICPDGVLLTGSIWLISAEA